MTVATRAADRPSGGINRSWEWTATPPQGKGSQTVREILAGISHRTTRRDGGTRGLRIRNAGYHAEIYCDGKLLVSTRRDRLLAWLRREGPREHYSDGELLLRSDQLGVWFELEGHTAPALLIPNAIRNITHILQN